MSVRSFHADAAALAAWMLVAAGPSVAAWSAEDLADFAGTEVLPKLGRLVLVYPAGDGEVGRTNRLSADRRAGYLQSELGCEVRTVADTEATEADLSGHLFAIGWSNALLRTPPFESIVRVDPAGGHVFLGEVGVPAGEDLMFSIASPVDPAKRWVFWSRIDPELDRFSVLPILGSDWARYRGYEVTAQGMLVDRSVFPPVYDPHAVGEFDDFRASYPVRARSAHYRLHHADGTLTPAEGQEILTARERALTRAIEVLGRAEPPLEIDLFVYPDTVTKTRASSVPDDVHSVGRSAEMHMLTPYARTPNPHEEMHLLAHRLFGPCVHTALYEGLALAFDEEASRNREVVAAALVERAGKPTIDALLDENRLRALGKTGLGYPAGGLLASWILERGGVELLGSVYAAEPLSSAELGAKLGQSAADVTASFDAWLVARAERGRDTLAFEEARARASSLKRRGDVDGAIVALETALAIRPDDADTLYRLALVEMNGERLSDAEKHLDAIIAQTSRLSSSAARYVTFGHYFRGRVYERTGRPAEARAEFERVLALPDGSDSHRMAREALEKMDEQEAGGGPG
ncbi:MAG TPA: tetratricopeptide repeat protein [Candidatus Polarisedimenticolaceae bacterium]|nr:tetratricopeptide repeat protein [Candidatus Polarisedimenticolaceae bacterium]